MQPSSQSADSAPPGATLRIGLCVLSLLLSVLIGLVFSGRSRSASSAESAGPDKKSASGRRPVIGLAFDTLKEERWQRDRAAFISRAHELGADTLDLSANSNDVQQVRDVESLITSRVDVLVIVAHNGAAMAKAVGLAHAAGIPVIAYDRLIPDCDLDFYITFDAVKVGALQAQYLLDHLPTPGHGPIVRLHGAKTDHNSHLIKRGQDQVLDPLIARGDVVVVHEDWIDDWKPENAKRSVNAAISRVAGQAPAPTDPNHPNDPNAAKDATTRGTGIVGVLAPNDGTAGGAAQALLEEGLSGKLVITGQDAELAACQRILAGTQTMTVYKPLKRLAGRAAEVAVSMARGRPVVATAESDNGRIKVPSIFIDVVAVDQKNLAETIVKDDFHSAAAIGLSQK